MATLLAFCFVSVMWRVCYYETAASLDDLLNWLAWSFNWVGCSYAQKRMLLIVWKISFGRRIKTAHVTPIKKATPLLPPDWRCMEAWPAANNTYQMALKARVSVLRSFGKCTKMQHQFIEYSEFCVKVIMRASINWAKRQKIPQKIKEEKASNEQNSLKHQWIHGPSLCYNSENHLESFLGG